MCGLGGVVWKNGAVPANASAILDRMEAALAHRGPDGAGRLIGPGFGVVHRRLAVVDIAAGQQPMTTADGKVGLIYNGEIYNHEALRRSLGAEHEFRTRCDTESLLEAYAAGGLAAIRDCDGMSSAFVWDLRGARPQFRLFRDRLGIKPLYYYQDSSKILFASELRAILAAGDLDLDFNAEGVQNYLSHRYTTGRNTIFSAIHRVEAGFGIQIRDGNLFHERYWDIPAVDIHNGISENEAAEEIHALLKASVKDQMMGEVPIGLTLSGGIDSSVIACLCDELGAHFKSFNIGFPGLNEFEYSNAVAEKFGQDHCTIETTVDDIVQQFETVVWAMDEPIADAACFPLHILCREIRKSVTVVLSGEGSDEILGGYPQYSRLLESEPLPTLDQLKAFKRYSWYFDDAERFVVGRPDPVRADAQASYFLERGLLDGMLQYDLKTWLPENLMMKADKILMAFGLEGRFPFLGNAFVEFASSLPPSQKWRDGVGKLVLRRAFANKLPKSVLERPKMGFSVPVDELVLRLKDRFYSLLHRTETLPLAGILDLPAVKSAADLHFAGLKPDALRIWTFLVLLQWNVTAVEIGALNARPAPMARVA